jgi:hypothetical protein
MNMHDKDFETSLTSEPPESAFHRATKVLADIRHEAEAHASLGATTPGPEADPPSSAGQDRGVPDSHLLTALSARLSTLEQTIQSLTTYVLQANHGAAQGLEANHLARGLQRQTEDLVRRIELIEVTVRRLEERVIDVDRMAAAVWDETAITRRLARLEDVLARKDVSPTD